ncbi:MAG: AAA family ATPase [Planctomycetes bacterium]|nr:AAA family ATPase [Planctomycetota bacterium]
MTTASGSPVQSSDFGIGIVTEYWGIGENPFSERIDTRYLYLSDDRRTNLNRMRFFVRDGFSHVALLTGDVGLGKTLLLRKMRQEMDGTDLFAVYVAIGNTTYRKILNDSISALLATPYFSEEADDVLLHQFERAYTEIGRRIVLVIDEAQGMNRDLLSALVGLSNLGVDGISPPCIILGGTPTLLETVQSVPEVAGRVSVYGVLTPLDAREVALYVAHRMKVAGHLTGDIIGAEAGALLAEKSAGNPRRVNQVMRRALLLAFGAKESQITRNIVAEAGDWARLPEAVPHLDARE